MTIGIDFGDVWSHYCTLNQEGEAIDRGRFRTIPKTIEKWLTDVPPARVAMEASTHSIWISDQLQKLDEVIVANVSELRAISHSTARAIRSTPRNSHGTHTSYHFRSSECGVRIAIADNGIGISDENKQNLFTPVFHNEERRWDGSRSLDHEGLIGEKARMYPVPQLRFRPVRNCNENLSAFNLAGCFRR
jgi:hypothetical protein